MAKEKLILNGYITNEREIFFDLAKKYIKPDSIILDIGSGDGSFAKYINRYDTYLVDGNPITIELLKNNFTNVFLSKLPNLPFKDQFFDIIHCSHIFEHLTPEILYDTLKEINRVLKKEGVLIISTPLLWSEFYDDLSHIKPYNQKIFKKYLVWGERFNCTRELISKDYLILEEVYRYNKLNFFDNIYHKNLIINRIIKMLSKLISLIGFYKLEKSGYTLILKKVK